MHLHQWLQCPGYSTVRLRNLETNTSGQEWKWFTINFMTHGACPYSLVGLGSRFIEEIRSEVPLAFILSIAVAPHLSGDSPLQHYNTLLATSWLQKFVDGIVMFQNDVVLEEAESLAQKGAPKGAGKPCASSTSLQAMNSYIAECLANALMPTDKRQGVCTKCSVPCTHSEWYSKYSRPGF